MALANLVRGVRQGIGNLVDIVGTKLKAPEYRVSERIAGGRTVNTPRAVGGMSVPISSVAPRQSVLGTGTSSPTSSTPPSGSTYTPTYDSGTQNREGERSYVDEEQERVRSAINEAYDPIFAQLDERIGLVGPQREEFLSGVEGLVTPQQGLVESGRVRSIAGLETAKTEEEGVAKSAIRDLEQDVRNQMKATGNYFGSLGAGDSSATGLASEAISRASLQTRGRIKEGLVKALTTIDTKIADVNTLASDQLLKIDQWKGNQIQSIKSFFLSRLDDLENSKAGATGAKASAIANMIQNTEQDYVNRLRKLDDDIYNFKNSISTWQMQRQADLEDFGKKLAIQSSYTGTSGANYTKALQDFNRLNETLGAEEARKTIIEQYGIDPLGGVELSGEDATRKAESPFAELERGIAGSLSATGAQKTGINLGPFRVSF